MRIEKIEQFGEIKEFVFFDNEDGSYTSIEKSIWDAQQAAKEANGTLS